VRAGSGKRTLQDLAMNDDSSSNFGLPEDYDIEEISDSENVESSAVVKAGEVQTWKPKHVTTIPEARVLLVLCLVLWPIYAVTTLVMAVLTRDSGWITAFGAAFTPLILVLLQRYFHCEDRS